MEEQIRKIVRQEIAKIVSEMNSFMCKQEEKDLKEEYGV